MLRYTLPLTPGDDPGILGARLWAAGAETLRTEPHLMSAWFAHAEPDVPPGGTWQVEPDLDWNATWRASVRPVRAGRLHVVPTWLVADHDVPDGDVRIVLDPAGAFGSGHHATTTLCLELLQDHGCAGLRVLDVGCGSGILAIAACLLGAREVVGVDLDADAVAATRRNAAANDVSVAARRGSVEVGLDELGGPAGLVLANLLSATLVQLAGALAAATAPGGAVLASGISLERGDEVAAALTAAGLSVEERRDRGGWTALRLRR